MKTELTTKLSTSRLLDSAASRPIDLRRAAGIIGPLDLNELRWLSCLASCSSVVIELGALLGRLTRALGDHVLGRVFAVDMWPDREAYQMFMKNISGLEEKVEPIHNTAKNAFLGLSLRLPQGADLVFVSGTHSGPEIRDCILSYHRLICPGGIIAGSGYGSKPDVASVVDAQFRKINRRDSIWWTHV